MIFNRSLNLIFLSFISIVVLLITAKRLPQWEREGGHYHTGEFSQNVVVNSNGTATASPESASVGPTPVAIPTTSQGLQSLRPDHDPICDGFPDTSGILLVMKTGATEAFDKLPTQLITILRCLPDFLLFSDLDQHIAGYHVRDSLETVLNTAKDDNSDFNLYRQQKDCVIDQDMCSKTLDGAQDAGWNLDKYKNIHMAEKAHRLRPGYDWYFFVDADTYVCWPNLVQVLRKLDPSKPRYLGSPTIIGGYPFAHGGSGYVVSSAAMMEFAGQNPGIANKYDPKIKDVCCGDYMFAVSLNDTIGITVESLVSDELRCRCSLIYRDAMLSDGLLLTYIFRAVAHNQWRETIHVSFRAQAVVPRRWDNAPYEQRGGLRILGVRAQTIHRDPRALAAQGSLPRVL